MSRAACALRRAPRRRLTRRGGVSPLRQRRAWAVGSGAAPPDSVLRRGPSRGWVGDLWGLA